MKKIHTFSIAAYKESPYLEKCIKSLLNQTIESKIILCTSTPNNYINSICKKYKIEVYINNNSQGVADDFNFAYSMAKTEIVTIAHQDDIYVPKYAQEVIKRYQMNRDAIVIYPDYQEIRNEQIVEKNSLLIIKRIMNFPLRFKFFQKSIMMRRLILAFGCPICCSSITFNKSKVNKENVFDPHFKIAPDWNAWLELAKNKGRYIYINKPLVYHRIDEESTTTSGIRTGLRMQEDYEVYCKLWPKWIAKRLTTIYANAGKSNELK